MGKKAEFKSELNIFKLICIVAAAVVAIALVYTCFLLVGETKHQKENEAALNEAVGKCVSYCDLIYEEMGRADDASFLARKENVANAKTVIGRYNAANQLMSSTEHIFTYEFKDKIDIYYVNEADPNDYDTNEYEKKITNLQNELYAVHNDLKIARDNYSVVKIVQ